MINAIRCKMCQVCLLLLCNDNNCSTSTEVVTYQKHNARPALFDNRWVKAIMLEPNPDGHAEVGILYTTILSPLRRKFIKQNTNNQTGPAAEATMGPRSPLLKETNSVKKATPPLGSHKDRAELPHISHKGPVKYMPLEK